MLHALLTSVVRMSARLQHIIEANQIRLNIRIRIGDRVPDTCLRRQIHHNIRLIFGKYPIHRLLVSQIPFNAKVRALTHIRCQLLDFPKSPFLDTDIIIIIHVIKAYNGNLRYRPEKFHGKVASDKSCHTCDKNCFSG